MRTEQEMMELILGVAKADEHIRAVSMEGSRANLNAPKDQYRDYDITYYVADITPFYNNPAWVEEKFGKPLIMQMPEAMRRPDGGGHFNYQMIFSDGNRLDLTLNRRRRWIITHVAITSGGAKITQLNESPVTNCLML